MKHNQGGVRFSWVFISVVLLGLLAWFNQASAEQGVENAAAELVE